MIIGISEQDGSYLSELLLSKGNEVHGIIHRTSSFNGPNVINIGYGSDITIKELAEKIVQTAGYTDKIT